MARVREGKRRIGYGERKKREEDKWVWRDKDKIREGMGMVRKKEYYRRIWNGERCCLSETRFSALLLISPDQRK